MAETVRELAARLKLEVDKASFTAGDNAIGQTKASLTGLGAASMAVKALMVGAVAEGMKKAFVDFNSTVEQSTIQLAAVQQMFKGGEWQANMNVAQGLFKHYQEVAKKSVGETQDFIQMHKSIAAAAYAAGANLDDLKVITKGAVVAGMTLGESAYTSAMDIKQALTKGVEVRDRFANLMLQSVGVEAKTFNAMKKSDRLEVLKKAFSQKTIQDAAGEMEKSFAGVTSTLKDNLSIALGTVGKNFFDEKKGMLAGINEWIDKNPQKWLQFQAMMETGLNAVSGIMKGIGAIAGVALAPVMQMMKGLADLEDYGRYKAGESSVRGLEEAKAKGPEALDYYIRTKVYGEKNVKGAGGKRIFSPEELKTGGGVGENIGEIGAAFAKESSQGNLPGFMAGIATDTAKGMAKFVMRPITGVVGTAVENLAPIVGRGISGPMGLAEYQTEIPRRMGSAPGSNVMTPEGSAYVPYIPSGGIPTGRVEGNASITVKVEAGEGLRASSDTSTTMRLVNEQNASYAP